MQKKLIAVAVAGALGAPALAYAQASTVQVYGTIYMEYSKVDGGKYGAAPGVDHANPDMLQTPGSEIGFKGEEQLGGGMSAWFQCNSTADIRGQSQDGWCSRNSGVGLKGGWGNAWIGNWDTPWKRVFGVNRIANETGSFGVSFLLAGGSTTVLGRNNPGEWVRRQESSINYDSPNFSGFQLMIATNASSASSNQLSTNPVSKPRLWSLGGTYTNGPLNIGLAYEQHKDFSPSSANAPVAAAAGSRSSTDKAWLLSGGYVYGPVKLGAMYTKQNWDTGTAAAPTSADVKAWQVAAEWTISGPHGLRAAYTKAGDMGGNNLGGITGSGVTRPASGSSTGAKLWQIHYVHTLSKRTIATFGYAKLNNDTNAQYVLGSINQGVTPGQSQSAWGATITHRF